MNSQDYIREIREQETYPHEFMPSEFNAHYCQLCNEPKNGFRHGEEWRNEDLGVPVPVIEE